MNLEWIKCVFKYYICLPYYGKQISEKYFMYAIYIILIDLSTALVKHKIKKT